VTVRTAPCDWPLAHCGEPGSTCSSLDALNPSIAALISEAATAYLWNWTGRRFGLCEIALRPCRESCIQQYTTYRGRGGMSANLPWFEGTMGAANPALIGGQWFNLGCGGSCGNNQCSCTYVAELRLPGPIDSVTGIYLDGTLLPASAYRVDNNGWVVRTDGGDWPACQDMNGNPLTDDGTFLITYLQGVPVPAGGQLAAGVLACEMAKAACSNGTCRLPQRIQTITRQGVTTAFLDSFDTLYKQGTTGLAMVDMWVASITGTAGRSGARAISPDTRGIRRTTSS
jgi:hypothetical protein